LTSFSKEAVFMARIPDEDIERLFKQVIDGIEPRSLA